MENHELSQMRLRIERYEQLQKRLVQLDDIREVMNSEFGHHKQTAFTGNTRESRDVSTVSINFTHTKGGEPPVSMNLNHLNIPATTIGLFLAGEIAEQRAKLVAEIKAL